MTENPSGGKTLLFLCKCSSNISNTISFDSIIGWARDSGDVNVVAISNLLCSPAGKNFFSEVVQGRKVKSIVVAACSPKQHEKTFHELSEKHGVNMSRVLMANIREQCAWVTDNSDEATEKAKKLINAAIKRSFHAKDLHKQTMKINSDVLIIGGGIAGMEAALTLSRAGRKVYLVEKDISLGGSVIKVEDIAPNMECSPCLLAPILSDVRDDPNIEVISNARVEQVLGFFGNFTVKVKRKARYVKASCIGCEECFSACPVEAESMFHDGLGKRKAVYTLFPGSVPAGAVIDSGICLHFKDNSCDACAGACPFSAIDFDDMDEDLDIQAGSILIATGYKNGDLSSMADLGHKKIDNVYTMPEFERLASSNGPTGGNIKLKNGEPPSIVAVIHCAGSMREDGIPYCSSVCCTTALKAGELLRKKNPGVKVYNIHNDLVFTNPREFQFYRRQKEEGTEFIKNADLASIKVSASGENGKIRIEGGIAPIDVDMVILSTGMLPSEDSAELSGMLNIELDKDGFFLPDHEILHVTGSALDGVYVAGCAAMPVNIAGSITQARAVAGDMLSKLIPDREIELEVMTSFIDGEQCAGCRLCLAACPYKAIYFDPEKNVSVVNEVICRGCGTCAATCPSGACTAKHYTDEQIYAEIGGILHG